MTTLTPPATGRRWSRLVPRSLMLDRLSTEGRSQNNFDLLRTFAALAVLFGHSFNVTGHPEFFPAIPELGWGGVGVLIFFGISGFLVTRSWDFDPNLLRFAAKRALRLMPGLVVSLLLTAVILGPLLTTESLSSYFTDPATKAFVYANATMQTAYALPGVFVTNVYPIAVNGSLWTLPVEVRAYVAVAIVGAIGMRLRVRPLMLVLTLYACLALLVGPHTWVPGAGQFIAELQTIQITRTLIDGAELGLYVQWIGIFTCFTVGSALYYLRRYVPILWPLCLGAMAGCAAAAIWAPDHAFGVWCVLAPYVVLCLAYRTHRWVRMPHGIGDYSYGIYVYAFPVQQTLSQLLAPMSAWALFALAVVPTIALGALSWHFIEAPALRFKRDKAGASAAPAPG